MGCDVHFAIQVFEAGAWQHVAYQSNPYDWEHPDHTPQPVPGVPIEPEGFDSRNYALFAILANVRNAPSGGVEPWPSIAADRGFPPSFYEEDVPPDVRYLGWNPLAIDPLARPLARRLSPYTNRWMGDHSFTWVGLDELHAFDWDGKGCVQTGVIPADEFERLVPGSAPTSYASYVSGALVKIYSTEEYLRRKATGEPLEGNPHVRVAWQWTPRRATGDWPGRVLPWLDEIAHGRALRLVMGFDN